MMKFSPYGLLLGLALSGLFPACGSRENDRLKAEVDSLRHALVESHRASATLAEVASLLDSIDATRRVLRVNLVEGTPYDDFTGRMRQLNGYIAVTEKKISRLEQSLRVSGASAETLTRTVSTLKAELARKTDEIDFLEEEVEKYRRENENLTITVNLQDAEIADKQAQIEMHNQELALIEARIQELLIQAKVSEADAYYARGEAIEMAAARTRLAPRKRRETLQEALDMYRKAFSLGKAEAATRIEALEGRL